MYPHQAAEQTYRDAAEGAHAKGCQVKSPSTRPRMGAGAFICTSVWAMLVNDSSNKPATNNTADATGWTCTMQRCRSQCPGRWGWAPGGAPSGSPPSRCGAPRPQLRLRPRPIAPGIPPAVQMGYG